MKSLFCMLAICVPMACSVHADELDDLVQRLMAEQKVPGAALGILRDGKVEKEAYYGRAVVEHEVLVTQNSVFRLASITKAVTTIAVLILHERGELDLDAPISRYLDDVPDNWKPITVRHLLSQTSGITFPWNRDNFPEFIRQNPEVGRDFILSGLLYDEAFQLKSAQSVPLRHTHGEGWAYSDSNFDFAGKVVHVVSGKSLREFVRDEIFTPLGMTSATFITPTAIIPDLTGAYALGEKRQLELSLAAKYSPGIPGGNGMYCNLRDLIKLEKALQKDILLKRDTQSLMWTPALTESGKSVPAKWFDGKKIDYGLGWFLAGTKEHPYAIVTGNSGTVWIRLPKDGITIVWLSNLERGHKIGKRDIVHFLVPALKGHTY